MSPFHTKGIAPKILITIQLKATVTNPSLVYTVEEDGFLCVKTIPKTRQIAAVMTNGMPASS